MFVTSDLFDLERLGREHRVDWRENLMGGVVVHGTNWLGHESLASFLLEASKRCGLLDEMEYAGYDRPGDRRTRPIAPKSFERLARGELAGARSACSVLLTGTRSAVGTRHETVWFGGEASGSERRIRTPTGRPSVVPDYPYKAFDADFIFPLPARPVERASELIRLAVEILGADYGYYFVRDELCGPMLYMHGMTSGSDLSEVWDEEGREIGDWSDFVRSGRLWTHERPLLRDLFQVNLLSERHTAAPVEGLGYLNEWIVAQPGRGRLDDLGRGRLLWTLTDAEMFQVRPLLNEAGLLFTCRNRNYRDLPDAPFYPHTPRPRPFMTH